MGFSFDGVKKFAWKLNRFVRYRAERREAIYKRLNRVISPKKRAALYARYSSPLAIRPRRWASILKNRLRSSIRKLERRISVATGLPLHRAYYVPSYVRYLLRRRFGRAEPTPELDLAIVVPEASHGWILGGIAREVLRHYPGTSRLCSDLSDVPHAKAYFLLHYSLIAPCLQANPHLWNARVGAYYTHPSDHGQTPQELTFAMNQVTNVVMCTLFSNDLVRRGIAADRIQTVLAGADPQMFRPHVRGGGAVGFCTAYYPRKNPDRILNIIRAMPQRRFILMGRNWDRYERFDELSALPNFTYMQAEYKDYPQFYRRLDVLVSPAILEGGPIPLIEAMMCNVVPVAGNTGHAPDIITHGENGYIFDVHADIDVICPLIERAFELQADVSRTVAHLTWKRFTDELCDCLGLDAGEPADASILETRPASEFRQPPAEMPPTQVTAAARSRRAA